nr:hypothetical protein [Desulfobacterales bacterium]
MKTLIGGAIAAILGIIGVVIFWSSFLTVLMGAIPPTLLLGGALAIYLGFDELKDEWRSKDKDFETSFKVEEVEKYKKEVEELKKEVERLKSKKEGE